LAISGGIGSGKSTAARYFGILGLPHLDMDDVARQVVQKNSHGLRLLTEAFGQDILTTHQTLHRKRLAQRCFQSPDKTQKLNNILHPLIWDHAHIWQKQQTTPWVIFEIPLLIESNTFNRVDFVAIVMARLALRKQRVLARGTQSEEAFNRIVQRQCNDQQRRQVADFIIQNDHKQHMQQQCKKLLQRLQKL